MEATASASVTARLGDEGRPLGGPDPEAGTVGGLLEAINRVVDAPAEVACGCRCGDPRQAPTKQESLVPATLRGEGCRGRRSSRERPPGDELPELRGQALVMVTAPSCPGPTTCCGPVGALVGPTAPPFFPVLTELVIALTGLATGATKLPPPPPPAPLP